MTRTVVELQTAHDGRKLSAALHRATALTVRCPAERFKAVSTLIAQGRHPTLADLELIITDAEPNEEVGRVLLSHNQSAALWKALPALKRLRLVGHAFCGGITHGTLERLELEGYGFGEGAVPPLGACPRLETLCWAFVGDEHGVALEPFAVEGLWTQSLPALEHLDLRGADLDGSLLDVATFLKAPLVKQLKTLGLPSGSTDGWRKVLKALPGLKTLLVDDPALAGLDKRMVVVEAAQPDAPGDDDDEDTVDLNALDDKRIAKAKLIERTQPLKHLVLSFHDLETKGASVVGQAVAAHPELQTLNLNNPASGGWNADALAAFVTEAGTPPALKALHLRNNDMAGSGKTLVALLAKCPHLEALELSQTKLDANDLAQVLPAISRLTRLRVLLMGNLDKTEASALSWKEFSSSSLQRLELWTTSFKDHWAHVFHNMGSRLPALEVLDLDAGRLTTKATAAFASGFHKHQHLRSLNLSLAPTTAAYESLRPFFGSTSLTSLELEEHSDAVGPDEDCDSAAIGVVRHAKALRQLSIEIDYRNTQKHQALAEALRAMPNLKALSGWRLAEKDPKVLRGLDDLLAASAVRTYKRLGVATTEALLRRNAIESLWLASDYSLDERLKSFAAALKATESLHTLILFGGGLNSPLDPKKAKLLLQVLGANTSLKALTLSLPMKVSVAKDVVRSLGKRGRIKTVNLAMPTTTDEQRQIVAAAKGTTQVSFVARLAEDWE